MVPFALARKEAAAFVGLSLRAFDRAKAAKIFIPNRVGSFNVEDLKAALQLETDGNTETGWKMDGKEDPKGPEDGLRLRIDTGGGRRGSRRKAAAYDDMVAPERRDSA